MSNEAQILKALKPAHPRLILDDAVLDGVRQAIETDPHAARIYAQIQAQAAEILEQPPSVYEIPDGRRLLSVSRRVKERVRTLALVHLLEGGDHYRERIWREVEAAAGFPDWNPAHFLDTAEMTHAVALAYDWLYGEWTPAQRRTMREAIIALGLEPAMKVYRDGGWWAAAENNWNQVCNGGIGIGALAIADEAPELAAQILYEATRSIPRAMRYYAPDGAGTEGVTYWDYGTRYNILFLSALESVLGTDFGLAEIEGFAISGTYQMYLSGADGMAFDFGDCGLRRVSTAQHFWMGRRYGMPEYSWFHYRELARPDSEGTVLDLLWFDRSARDLNPAPLPLDRHYRVAECMSIRSAWDDPHALVVGLQAGRNRDGAHRHLDLGTFILEALGERWIIDSGVEREAYQRHRNKRERWEFYRLRAEGHNTLVIDPDGGPDQELNAFAAIEPEIAPGRVTARIDLSDAYAGRARRVERTFDVIDRAYVLVSDHVEADAPAEVWWFLHTEAQVSLTKGGRVAMLQQNGKQVTITLAKPAGAAFEVMAAQPLPTSPAPELQASNEGRRKLAMHLQGVRHLDLLVEIRPQWTYVEGRAGGRLATGKQDAIAWLLQEGGPAIRYRTATELVDDATGIDVERLAADLVASPMAQQWAARIREPGDMWRYHGSNPDALENACAKLCELGLRAGMLDAFDQRMAPYRRPLVEDPGSVWNPITGACLTWAGFHEDAVRNWLRERLGVLYEVAQAGSYDIYIDRDTYGDYPAAFRKRPLVDPQYNGRLVGIWDVYAMAHWPDSLASPEAQDQIEAVIAYILHPDYQALDEGYGVMRAGPRRYYSIGWSVHLPGYDGFGFQRPIHAAMFVQRVELMAHFFPARQSAWFEQSLAHLESYRTDRGTYRFPAAYLREQANGYYVSGAYMRLEEDRRRRQSLELDSTFRMLKIRRLILDHDHAPRQPCGADPDHS